MATVSIGGPGANAPKRGWLKWLLMGCGSLILLVGAGVALVWFGVMRATAGPDKSAREFLAAAGAGDYAAAHDYFSAPLKQEQPFENFVSGARENSEFFQVTHTSFPNRSIDTSGAELTGTVTLKSGSKLPATFKLIKEKGQWKLLGYHIGS